MKFRREIININEYINMKDMIQCAYEPPGGPGVYTNALYKTFMKYACKDQLIDLLTKVI